MPPITFKDIVGEQSLLRSRSVAAQVIVVVFSAVLAFRSFTLQVVGHDHFKTLSEDNRVKLVAVPPTRGLIMDRNGVVLADNLPTYSLEVIPEAAGDVNVLLSALGAVLDIGESDERRFRRELERSTRFESVVLRNRLTEEEVARFAVNRHRFPGVDVHARLTRHYPLGPLTSHVVGYVGRINEQELSTLDPSDYRGTSHIGKTGVERFYEDSLHGRVGYEQVETNAAGRTLRVLDRTDPVPGQNVYLSVDVKLQQVAEEALGDNTGAVVALDPRTGHVLAFVSVPTFDPNLFVNGIDVKTYRELSNSPLRPLFNRALNGRYPPGSTVKPFFALAGLQENADLAYGSIMCRGFYQLKGKSHRYRDWKRSGHGKIRLKDAVAQSCDVFFYALALELGIDRMHSFMTRFGFGERTGVDLPGESSGLMPSRGWKRAVHLQPWYPGETLITGIGQGFMLATPLQLASATATLAMTGERYRPRVVERLEDATTLEEIPRPFELADPVTASVDHWWQARYAMREVVHGKRGTARHIGKDLEFEIAGKTGTSQVFTVGQNEEYKKEELARELQDHALFISFAPLEEPTLAVAVLVEHGGSGSKAAAPVARKVIDAYFGRGKKPKENLLVGVPREPESVRSGRSAVVGVAGGG